MIFFLPSLIAYIVIYVNVVRKGSGNSLCTSLAIYLTFPLLGLLLPAVPLALLGYHGYKAWQQKNRTWQPKDKIFHQNLFHILILSRLSK